MQIYIKMPKEFIRTNTNTKDKKCLLISYLFFHTTCDKEIYTSIDCICTELKLSVKSHGVRRSQNIFKDLLQELIDQKIIQFISTQYCNNFESIANDQMFKIKLNTELDFFNTNSNYIRIEKYEYDAIMSINDSKLNKIFNIFYQIKSYVCMDDNCLHMCYPAVKTLCDICKCSYTTLSSIIKILYDHKLIYLYRFNDQEKIIMNRNIDYVFALEEYTKDQVFHEFVA